MIIKIKSVIKKIIYKLFNEEQNTLETMGVSINDITNSINEIKTGDKKGIENIKHDIDFALGFSEVISIGEKQGLETLKLEIEKKY